MVAISLASPPIAFLIVLAAALLLSRGLKGLSLKTPGRPKGGLEPYACGEEASDQMVQPDYGQFFPFAVFFTILHVVALMVTTVPVETVASFAIAVIDLVAAVMGLVVLYRR